MPEVLNHFAGLTQKLNFFTKKLRLSNPWNYKVPLLITFPYLLILVSTQKNPHAFYAILASVLIIVGVAGLGYLSNDLGDKNKDTLIEKQNATSELTSVGLVFLFVLFFLLAIVPWAFMPLGKWTFVLLSGQFVLFYVYAFPPFRLKERGIFGVVADACYAHLIPAILASYTFFLYGEKSFQNMYTLLVLLGLWQFVLGLRNILFHQVNDMENDMLSDTLTFAMTYGKKRTENLLQKIVLPLEVLLFSVFVAWLSHYMFLLATGIVLYWGFTAIQLKFRIKQLGVRQFAYTFLDDVYIKWVPLFVLLELVFTQPLYFPILIMHVLLFKNGFKTTLFRLIKK